MKKKKSKSNQICVWTIKETKHYGMESLLFSSLLSKEDFCLSFYLKKNIS